MKNRSHFDRRQFLLSTGQAAALVAIAPTLQALGADPRVTPPAAPPKKLMPRRVPFAPRKIIGLENFPGYLPIHFDLPSTTTLDVAHRSHTDGLTTRVTKLRIDLKAEPEPLLFYYQTKDQNVAHMLVQISATPFPPEIKDWPHPLGLIDAGACGVVREGSGTIQIPVRLYNQVLYGDALPKSGFAKAKKTYDRDAAPFLTDDPSYKGVYSSYRGLIATCNKILAPHDSVPAYGDYYIRVIPLNAKGVPVGGASNQVHIESFPPAPEISTILETHFPTVHFTYYERIAWRWKDANRQVIITWSPFPPGQVPPIFDQKRFTVGAEYVLPEPDDGIWAEMKEFVGEIWETLENAEGWLANAYQTIQNTAINTVAMGSPEFKTFLKLGMEVGLTSLGIPPTLPTFDELVNQGKDYLSTAVADQVPGLPPEVIRTMIDSTAKGLAASAKGASDPSAWCRPNPRAQYHPAYVDVLLKNDTDKATTPAWLYLTAATKEAWVHMPAKVLVPVIAKRSSITIRVSLKECPSAVTAEVWSKNYTAVGQMNLNWVLVERNPPAMGGDKILAYKPTQVTGSLPGLTGNVTTAIKA